MRSDRKKAGFIMCGVLILFLSACGGGGGGEPPPPPLAPTVITSTVNTPNIDNTVINGSVNPNGLAATAWFEYGTDSTLSTFTKTADQTIVAGTVPQSINAALLGLNPGTKYYFRVSASSTAGASKGTIENFTTTSPPPTTVTTQAGNITITSATLNGSVNPNGLATTAWFEYGTDPALSPPFTKTDNQAIVAGKAAVPVTQSIGVPPLPPLIVGTTYYFRVAASNTGGETKGSILFLIPGPNPPPIANSGFDQSVFMGHPATLNGSASSDGGNGGTITYQWTQVAGTTVTLSGATTANPTFIAPPASYPSEVLTFQLTVTSSRGTSASDNVNVTNKWGYFDDFSTDTIGTYTTVITFGTFGTFTYDAVGQRGLVRTGNDNVLMFIHSLPASDTGVFSIVFSPTVPYPSHGGIWIRLKQDDNNYYEVSDFDYTSFGNPPKAPDLAGVRKYVGGVKVEEKQFSTSYTQGTNYDIKITFSPAKTTMEAFGTKLDLTLNGTSISVNKFEVETGQQDAYYDNIKLEAAP